MRYMTYVKYVTTKLYKNKLNTYLHDYVPNSLIINVRNVIYRQLYWLHTVVVAAKRSMLLMNKETYCVILLFKNNQKYCV